MKKESWIILVHESYKYSRKGEYWKSIELAQKALELNPRASEAWRLIGNSYELLGDILIKGGKFPRPHSEKSWAIFDQYGPKEYHRKAAEAWDKAKEINPKIIIPGYHK